VLARAPLALPLERNHLETIQLGHVNVQQHQVKPILIQGREGRPPSLATSPRERSLDFLGWFDSQKLIVEQTRDVTRSSA
jgi:hypothetical protein